MKHTTYLLLIVNLCARLFAILVRFAFYVSKMMIISSLFLFNYICRKVPFLAPEIRVGSLLCVGIARVTFKSSQMGHVQK